MDNWYTEIMQKIYFFSHASVNSRFQTDALGDKLKLLAAKKLMKVPIVPY